MNECTSFDIQPTLGKNSREKSNSLSFFKNKKENSGKKFQSKNFLSRFYNSKDLLKNPENFEKLEEEKLWIKKKPFFFKRFIKQKFLKFFFNSTQTNLGQKIYIEEIINICSSQKKIFSISFQDLISSDPLLALWMIDEPEKILKICKKTCLEIISDVFPKMSNKLGKIAIQITEIPICDPIRKLNRKKIGCMVKTKGRVIFESNINPSFNLFKLVCLKCTQLQKTIFSASYNRKTIFTTCFNCNSTGPFRVSWYKVIHNSFQTIIVQEPLIDLNFESIYFTKEIILKNHLIDSVQIGQEIMVSGILKCNYLSRSKVSFVNPNFSTFIEANYIEKIPNKTEKFFFTKKEEEKIQVSIKKKNILFSLGFFLFYLPF